MPPRRSGFRPGILLPLIALLGLLPVLPMLLTGSPVLNNDMLVAYFCYFWDFHRNWSWDHPLVFWSSSYQTGMPMHAYWQSGYLYPITWMLFGPVSPHIGIHLFYAFHFALGIFGFLKLGPRLALHRPASLWAGLGFALGGTVLARYEHATFLAGWTWLPLVLAAFLALRDRPGPRSAFLYAAAVALQALGGHPQASATTAVLIGIFTAAAFPRSLRLRRMPSAAAAPEDRRRPPGPESAEAPAGRSARASAPGGAPASRPLRRAAWIAGGHLLALLYCAPLVLPFLDLVDDTERFDGKAWEGRGEEGSAGKKLEEGVFAFEKFSTGGVRPIHLASLAAAHALGSPSNASWWGGEVWGEVFLYLGVLGLFFTFFASWKRAGPDMRLLWMVGLLGLWLAFGAHLGASQILYHVPVFNNFRRPARFLILFAFALAALSAHGLQRWTARPGGRRLPAFLGVAGLFGAAGFLALRLLPEANAALLDGIQSFRKLDPSKDYAGKIAALAGRLSVDSAVTALSGLALLGFIGSWSHASRGLGGPERRAGRGIRRRIGFSCLFLVLLFDLLRIHWDHFYLFPSSFYRDPPVTAAVLDSATGPFWRVNHYLQYPGLELWRMHNDPLASMPLLEREKAVLSHGIHAVFGYRHVSAHLPLLWKWEPGTGAAEKSGRYLFSNVDQDVHGADSLDPIGRFGEVRAYEVRGWRPRFERISPDDPGGPGGSPGSGEPRVAGGVGEAPEPDRVSRSCPEGYSGLGGLCVREVRDGRMQVAGAFRPGDTLVVRERAYPGWRFRLDGGAWQTALATRDHFLAVPISQNSKYVELTYVPQDLYIWTGIGLLGTLFMAILAFLRKKRNLP